MEEYVGREEFENLKKEVYEMKSELSRSTELLQKIDKKTDIISERLETSNKISDLQNEKIETNISSKLEPIKKDVEKNTEKIKEIKDNNKWLWTTIAGSVIAIIIKIVFDII